MIITILCKKCKKIIETQDRRGTKSIILSKKICNNCKKISNEVKRQRIISLNKQEDFRKKVSDRMSANNPMKNKDTVDKFSKTIKAQYKNGERISHFTRGIKYLRKPLSEEERRKASERMKINNPMRNKSVVNKMRQTIKDNFLNGTLKYKKGKDHHLWKGGSRDFNNACRQNLYLKWNKKILERDNYFCCKCGKKGKNGELNVHHITPLRDFIKEIKIKYNIISFADIDKENWQIYIDEIVSLHKLSDGITLCPKCHAIIDKYCFNTEKRKRKKKNED